MFKSYWDFNNTWERILVYHMHGSHLKNLEKGRTFCSQGKVMDFYPKYWKNQEILLLEKWNKYLKSPAHLAVRKVKTMEI